MQKRPLLVFLLTMGLLLPLTIGQILPDVRAAYPNEPEADFDGDRYADLAVGVPWESFAGPPIVYEPGVVSVLYGSFAEGLTGNRDQFWSEDSDGVDDTAGNYDHFGAALTAGDFNGDGFIDLAVGVSQQAIGVDANAGSVHVFYSTASGISADDEVWTQDEISGNEAEENDYFGKELASADFDGDGYDDLAIGVDQESMDVQTCGVVHIIYGSSNGLNADRTQTLRQGIDGISGIEELGDHFGRALTTGDYNSDGYADLSVGTPDEDLTGLNAAGAVYTIYGSASGLTATGNQMWAQDVLGVQGVLEESDSFGWSVTSGDFDNDGWDDLAVGVVSESTATVVYAGAVQILYGSATGLTVRDQLLSQEELGLTAHYNVDFGYSVSAADFDGDGYSDLAVGVPSEDLLGVGPPDNCGAVDVIYGGIGGLITATTQTWIQGSLVGLEDSPEEADQFGFVLAAADFNGDTYADLAVGIPYEDLELIPTTQEDAGAVQVIYGSKDGLTGSGDQFWHQGSPIRDTPEEDDHYGYALAAIPRIMYYINLPVVLRDD